MSDKIWEEIVEALVRLQIEADREQAKAKAEAKAAATEIARNAVNELWSVEMSKGTEEAVRDNMYPQRWA